MSAYVLLNLLNKFVNNDKMRKTYVMGTQKLLWVLNYGYPKEPFQLDVCFEHLQQMFRPKDKKRFIYPMKNSSPSCVIVLIILMEK